MHLNHTCYSGIYFLHLGVAGIGFFSLMFMSLLFNLLFIDMNPNSKIPFASPNYRTNFVKVVIKSFLPLYTVIDVMDSLHNEFIVIVTMVYLSSLVNKLTTPPMYNKSVYYFMLKTDAALFWISLCMLIHCFLDSDPIDNTGLVYFFVGLPIIIMAFCMIMQFRNHTALD